MLEPVLDSRDPAQVFLDVLFADPPHRDDAAVTIGEDRAEDPLGQEDALAVMAEGAVADVSQVGLRFVEPVVDGQVVFRLTAPPLDAGQRVMKRMSDGTPPFGYLPLRPARRVIGLAAGLPRLIYLAGE
jgi:hypothetical protein